MAKPAKKTAPKKTKAKAPAKKARPVKTKAAIKTAPEKKSAPAPVAQTKSKSSGTTSKTGFPSVSTPAARAAVVASGGTGKLGVKRTCRKCYAKFYDFEKNPIVCPKCHAQFSPEDFETKLILKSEPSKKPKPREVDADEEGGSNEDIVVISTNEDFESVEDLGEEENVIGNLSVDGDENDDEY